MANKHELVQLLTHKEDVSKIKDTLHKIRETLESKDIEFFKNLYAIACSHIASNILSPAFSSAISKQDVKDLIIPILIQAPIQSIQSFMNVILRLQNTNVEEIEKELIKNHIKVLIEMMDQVITHEDLIEFILLEIKITGIDEAIIATLFGTLPDRIYNAIVTMVPDSNFSKIRSFIPKSFQPKNYYSHISRKFSKDYSSNPSHISLTSSVLSSIARRGHTDEVASSIFFIQGDLLIEQLLERFPDGVTEGLLYKIIPHISDRYSKL
jgi:hypothetical protein